MTDVWCSRRACSWGVSAWDGVGDNGACGGGCDGLRLRLSIAGNEAFVSVWIRFAVTVSISRR